MVRWELLGDVGVAVDGSRVVLSGQRTRAVAAYLVLHHGHRISNERLVDALWGEHPPKTARNSVQRFVADLRHALDPASHRLVTIDGDYRLELVPGDRIDAVELADAITAARSLLSRGRADEALDSIAIGLDQLAGEPLGGIGDTEFGHAARARLDDVALDALEVRLEAQLALGRFADVAAEARSLADRYPYREMLWVHLMTGLYGSGRQLEALRAFQEVRQRLIDDLGVEPSTTLRETERRVLAQDLELVTAAEASAITPTARPARLSVAATKFFGRERELDLIESLLTADEGTLVTIVGPGGSGKTRIADRAISRVGGRFDDGVVVVELDGITDPTRVTPAVAAACGIQAAADPVAALVAHVQGRHTLLVLDNAEELADPVSALAMTVMASAPRVSVLVTSREALGISAEHRVDLTGLDLVVPPLRSATPAAALFTERARRLFAGFEPDVHVDRICALVGGLPLAIELAARWSSSMTADQIADRLEHDVGLLVTDAHDVPERQRTMAGVLEATWSRLDPAQADLASGLAIFVGGCDIDAAHAVCGASPLDLQRLVARSLLSWLPGGRLEMHELIRQHAAGQLDQDRLTTLRTLHAEYYLDRVGAGYPTFIGPNPATFIGWLDADFDNVVVAWNSAIAQGNTSAMAAASDTLGEFAVASGREIEVARLFEHATTLGPAHFTARMHTQRIRVSWHIEGADVIEELYERARVLLPGPTSEEATGRVRLAIEFNRHLLENTNETDRALGLIAECREELAQFDASRYLARLDALEARAAMFAGRFDHTFELLDRAIHSFSDHGDAMRASDAVAMTAGAYAEQGRVWEALQADLRALELRVQRRDARAISLAQTNTGASYVLVGAWDEAERHTLDAIQVTESLTDRSSMAYLDCQLAEVRVGQGRMADAETLFVRGVARLRHRQFALGLRLKLPEWARFLVDEQRWLEAGLVIDEARGLWEQVGGTHFQVLLDGLAARVCAGRGELDRAEMLARSAWECIRDTEGAGHPFPIRTLADCITALQPCDGTHDLVVETRAFATGLVERVLTSIEDPAYRKTYLAMPEVEHIVR